jgi:hypothetical protein
MSLRKQLGHLRLINFGSRSLQFKRVMKPDQKVQG